MEDELKAKIEEAENIIDLVMVLEKVNVVVNRSSIRLAKMLQDENKQLRAENEKLKKQLRLKKPLKQLKQLKLKLTLRTNGD